MHCPPSPCANCQRSSFLYAFSIRNTFAGVALLLCDQQDSMAMPDDLVDMEEGEQVRLFDRVMLSVAHLLRACCSLASAHIGY